MSQEPATPGEVPHPHRMRRIALVVIAVLLVVASFLVLSVYLALEQGSAGGKAQEATSVDAETLPATLPFRTVAGHVVVDALLEDAAEPLGFMFDSGAPVLLAADVADQFAGDPVGGISTRAVDGTIEQSDVVVVDRLTLGDAAFLDVAGPVGWVDEGNPLACVTTSGLLGANLMKDAVWQIDYQAERIGIHPSTAGLDHIDEAIALEFRADTETSPSPVVELPVGEETLTFLLDTGSDGALTMHPADLESIGLSLPEDAPTLTILGAGAAGTFTTDLSYLDVGLSLGDSITTYPVAVSETMQTGVGNIGNTFLREFVVTIDWPGRTVYLDPVAADRSIGGPAEPSAAGIAWDGERVVVGSLVRGGPSEQAGLELGEVVTAVGATDLQAPTFDDFCALLTATPPTEADAGGTTLTTADGSDYAIEVVEGFYD